MKRLIVMRHAKSDWEAGASSDHERPLNERGKREAPSVGARLAELNAKPDLALVSDATRTRETWDRIKASFPRATMELEPSFYLAGLDAVRERVARVDDDVQTVLILGHNPGWEELASALADKRVELKTAYAAFLEARDEDTEAWSNVLVPGGFKLRKVVKPTEG